LLRPMEVYVGTSGWLYGWNKKASLDWYVINAGLNAVELNASFYRFPFPNAVRSWAVKCRSLRWSIKTNRAITHLYRFNEKALGLWESFMELFGPLDHLIDFYLFQLPPSTKASSASAIASFAEKTLLGHRFAFEPRNATWFSGKWVEWARELGITLVGVDCPTLPLVVFDTSGIVYQRMHGRLGWYSHRYSDEELKDVATKIIETKSEKAYVFFNNNHAMLDNSRKMLAILKGDL